MYSHKVYLIVTVYICTWKVWWEGGIIKAYGPQKSCVLSYQ